MNNITNAICLAYVDVNQAVEFYNKLGRYEQIQVVVSLSKCKEGQPELEQLFEELTA